jgi:hypothetical protein
VHTKIKIFIDRITGQVRRIVVPGDHPGISEDQQLAAHKPNFDEIVIIDPYSGPTDLKSISAIVQRHTGKMMP